MKNATLLAVLFLSLCVVNSNATGTVTNLGPGVNASYSEQSPFVTSNGQTLYFSRFVSSSTGLDVYQATLIGGQWANAVPVTGVNSSSDDGCPCVIGNHMYFVTNRWSSPPFYPSRLARATYSAGNWGNVIQLPMTTIEGIDLDPSVTADETTLYFTTSRPPNYGLGDIYRATYSGGVWGNLENLGPVINTSGAEAYPSISPDGNTLHFIRVASFVYVSHKIGSTWSTPQLLPAPINIGDNKFGLCYRPELQKLYFSAGREGGYGGNDLWQCSSYNVQVEPVSLGTIRSIYHK